jgi:hypothetical protein
LAVVFMVACAVGTCSPQLVSNCFIAASTVGCSGSRASDHITMTWRASRPFRERLRTQLPSRGRTTPHC